MTVLEHQAAVRRAVSEQTGLMVGHLDDFHRALTQAQEANAVDNMAMFAADMREASLALLAAAGCAIAAAVTAERA